MKFALAALFAGVILAKNMWALLNAGKTAQEVEDWRKNQDYWDTRRPENEQKTERHVV